MKNYLACFFIIGFVWQGCGKRGDQQRSALSKEDSISESYLAFRDSIVQSWNAMINDDNEKILAMQNLLRALQESNDSDPEQLGRFEQQLDQLTRLRYTQKSMSNNDIIEEYDFASITLVRELISIAESRIDYNDNLLLQKFVDDIRLADDRVTNYREDYDDIVSNYNFFLEHNKRFLKEFNSDSLRKGSLFQMVSVD